MRKILVSIVLLLSCLQAAQAEKVSREQAEEAAVAFFRSARHAGISPVSAPSLRIVRCSSSVPAGLPWLHGYGAGHSHALPQVA